MNKKRTLVCGLFVQTIFAALLANVITSTPALAQNKALLIGNADYDPPNNDLPAVILDVLRKHNSLANADWIVDNQENLTRAEIINAIKNGKPEEGKFYFVWYAGHGSLPKCHNLRCEGGADDGQICDPQASGVCPNGRCKRRNCDPDAAPDTGCRAGDACDVNATARGDLVGVDGGKVTPQDFVGAITDAELGDVSSRTFVKLDSCGSGAFADAVNALKPAIGFQTATTRMGKAGENCSGGLFTTCYAAGLNGLADANSDGQVTVAEAAAYAAANCVFADSVPTWDGNFAELVIGATKTEAGYCTLLDGRCVGNISWEACVLKNGKWSSEKCIPTLSEWGVAVMAMLVLTAGTIVVMRRRAAVA